ncbi:16813_t:CDS:1 [Racocetra fulgida]|uniref:16813_t:CDS:1 n=1 Tax=Racocetra fulgida TaxID=60492 RepID=A0A9N8VTQ9_9GLOM|nr:16813_t:CDS:1 [Racocetra fulgida]
MYHYGGVQYEKLEPCEMMYYDNGYFSTFTVAAKIVADDYTKPTMKQIIDEYFSNMFNYELCHAGLARKKDIMVGGIIHTMEILKSLPNNYLESSIVEQLDRSYYHIITIWGGLNEPLVFYSCHDRQYYPSSAQERARAHEDYNYILETDVCKKYKSYLHGWSKRHPKFVYCAAKMVREENEKRTKRNRNEL